ncbi:AAA family ATPase [Tenggerimyces flavus]|uniref:AAA family ATPase n=1 Tax=Tenggerimyces flavus TaxID=1708749 RepID=A0ABV7YMI4_9ACTN|nr:AAA family ATPase [Tenggerimyces flavus]MBM7789636.1 DNA-binding CsgD family transcriptional regulator [Tenggerimyces flavus]
MADETDLVGRDRELLLLSNALAAAADGPVHCVLHGPAGIGKSVLWQRTSEAARRRGYVVLACRPAESEATLAFGGLGDLLCDVPRSLLETLPAPQRHAVDAALLRADLAEPVAASRAVRMATLAVVRALAVTSPVVVAVDDLQWLDIPTVAALEFMMRRLTTERVCVLASLRSDGGYVSVPFDLSPSLPEQRRIQLGLAGLTMGALHRLIRTRTGQALSRPDLRTVAEASGGNPFFALALSRARRGARQVNHPRGPLPLPQSLQTVVADRIAELPHDLIEPLAVIAALAQPRVDQVVRALPRSDVISNLANAEAAGIIEITDSKIRFTHPLFASAVTSAQSSLRGQDLHARLVDVVDDIEQKARHLATAANGPDPAVADLLEEAARQADRRGAPEAAADLWELAGMRTPQRQDAQRHGRLAAAGARAFHAGDARRADELLTAAVSRLPAGETRARALLDLADVTFYLGSTPVAVALCSQALDEAGNNRILRIQCGLHRAWYGTHNLQGQLQSIEAAVELVRDDDARNHPDLYACAQLMAAYYRFFNGLGLDREAIEFARGLVRADDTAWAADWARMVWRSLAKYIDLVEVRAAYVTEYDLCASVGDESSMGTLSMHLAEVDCWLGDWKVARDEAERSMEILEQCGHDRWRGFALYAWGLVAAHQGELEPARNAALQGFEFATRTKDPWVSGMHLGLLGFIELSRHNIDTAIGYFDQAESMLDTIGLAEPARHPFQADHLQAVLARNDLERASALLQRLEERMERAPYPWLAAVTLRSRGLVRVAHGDLDGARDAIDQALKAHDELPMPFEHARTLLVQGQLLRRAKEKRSARAVLLAAKRVFDELGAAPWSEATADELGRLGLRRGTIGELTPTEEQIALLVARGHTNREAAASAFVSVKSVEANLTRIYRKLGIRTRRDLSRLLGAPRS